MPGDAGRSKDGLLRPAQVETTLWLDISYLFDSICLLKSTLLNDDLIDLKSKMVVL